MGWVEGDGADDGVVGVVTEVALGDLDLLDLGDGLDDLDDLLWLRLSDILHGLVVDVLHGFGGQLTGDPQPSGRTHLAGNNILHHWRFLHKILHWRLWLSLPLRSDIHTHFPIITRVDVDIEINIDGFVLVGMVDGLGRRVRESLRDGYSGGLLGKQFLGLGGDLQGTVGDGLLGDCGARGGLGVGRLVDCH